jgi:hypothetical protein
MQRYKGGSATFDEAGYARGGMPSPAGDLGFAQGAGVQGKQGDPMLGGRPQRTGPAPAPAPQEKFQRVSPGMYRGANGRIVRSPQNPGAPRSPLVGALAEGAAAGAQNALPSQLGGAAAGMLPGRSNAPMNFEQFRPGQVENVGQQLPGQGLMGQAQGMAGMYTKPAIISGPGGGEPIRNLKPFPFNPQDAMQRFPVNTPGMGPDQFNNSLAGIAGQAAPQPMPIPERRTMPAVGFIGRNSRNRMPGA